MEYLLLTIARARVSVPSDVLRWVLDTATPGFRSWTTLLGRTDVTDAQAWALLWRDGRLERSAEKVPQGSEGYWTSNRPSERLAGEVAYYLSRPDVPSGAVRRVRERFDETVLTRLDLLREVTRLGASDIVCHEVAAEPPAGSSRGHQLGARELALIERYRNNARIEEREKAERIAVQVAAILEKDDLRARVECARSLDAFGAEILEKCLFGHGSVSPPPESADAASAEWLEKAASRELIDSLDSFLMGRILSAVRPIVRMYRDPADRSAERWGPRRIRDFGQAGTVPLTFSIPAEEGEYIIRTLGNDAYRYEKLAVLVEEQPNVPLGELCRVTERLDRPFEARRTCNSGSLDHSLEGFEEVDWDEIALEPVAPDLDAVLDVWPEVSAQVLERSRTTHVMLSRAKVQSVDGNRIVLALDHEALARRLDSSRHSSPIVESLRAVLGVDFEVSCTHHPTRGNGAVGNLRGRPGTSRE